MKARILVVTEGLLIYLSEDQVVSLANDLSALASFRWWLTDLASPALLAMLQTQGDWGDSLASANAPFKFAPPDGTRFFEPHGWSELRFRSTFEEAQRLQRLPPPTPPTETSQPSSAPALSLDEIRRFSATVLLGRNDN